KYHSESAYHPQSQIRMHGYLQMFQQLEAWRVPIYELPSLQAGSHYHLFSQDARALYHYSLQRLNQNDEYIRLSVPRHPELKKQILSYAFEFFRGLNSFFPAVRNDFFAYGRVLLFLQVHLMI